MTCEVAPRCFLEDLEDCSRPRVDTTSVPPILNLVQCRCSGDSPRSLEWLNTKRHVSLDYHLVVYFLYPCKFCCRFLIALVINLR